MDPLKKSAKKNAQAHNQSQGRKQTTLVDSSSAESAAQSPYSKIYKSDPRIDGDEHVPVNVETRSGREYDSRRTASAEVAFHETKAKPNSGIDVTSRFLQYLRDWEENFARHSGSSSPASEVSVPGFEPAAIELNTTWSSNCSTICCLNTYPNGITFSLHSNTPASALSSVNKKGKAVTVEAEEEEKSTSDRRFGSDQFHLRFRDTRDLRTPAGRYHLHRENAARALEQHLAQLHRAGKLNDTVLYFGTMTDPFLSLHKKFDVTMSCLDVIERYAPGRVVFQTRSPMVISVLPALKKLGSKAVVVIGVETNSEKAVLRYTPGMPRIAERLIAADGLRKQGVMVNLQVSPILPYGDFLRDAWDFAELLERHADYVTFGSLSTGNPAEERFLRSMPIAQRLSSDGMFAWLRPYAYQAVFHALSVLARDKLLLPVESVSPPKQLKLFAA